MRSLTLILSSLSLVAWLTACGTSQDIQSSQPAPRSGNAQPAKQGDEGPGLGSTQGGTTTGDTVQEDLRPDTNQSGVLDPGANTGGVTTPVEQQPATTTQPVAPAQGVWKGLLMTGDNSINAFDNARKKLKQIWTGMGIDGANLKELSMKSTEQSAGVLATNRDNMQQALGSLALGPDDKCIVFMTSHGSQQGFYLKGQSTMAPSELDSMLTATCGDRPTIVLVSACYSGVFISSAAMKKPNRIILTAARPDRTSFGCGSENEYTYWDNCLIDNFQAAKTWNSLYDTIKSCITTKEAGGFTPSEPQAFFGDKMQNHPIFSSSSP